MEVKMKVSSAEICLENSDPKRYNVIFKIQNQETESFIYDITLKNSPRNFLFTKYREFLSGDILFSELLETFISIGFVKENHGNRLMDFLRDKDLIYFVEFDNSILYLNKFFTCYFNETFIDKYKEFNTFISRYSFKVMQSLESDLHFRFKIFKDNSAVISSEGIFDSEQDAKYICEEIYKKIVVYDMFRR